MALKISMTIKRFVVDTILEPVLSLGILQSYVIFWGHLVFRLRKPCVIGITGTVGKSTTTAMIAAVLSDPRSERYVGRVGNTVENMNDDIGVAATLLRYPETYTLPWAYWRRAIVFFAIPIRAMRALLSDYPKIMVLEFGIGPTASFERMMRIAPPHIGIVTTIGAAHLATMKTIDGVVREKGRLVRAVSTSGLVIIGDDHEYVEALESMARAPVSKASGRGIELSRKITAMVCAYLGVPDDIVASALRDFRTLDGRLKLLNLGNVLVIDDSYNATVLSMRLGLDTLAATAKPGQRRVAILGYMAALGDESVRYHSEIGELARSRADLVIGVGDLAQHYRPHRWFANSADCVRALESFVHDGDCVFVKGSFAARMAHVVEGLRALGERRPHRADNVFVS